MATSKGGGTKKTAASKKAPTAANEKLMSALREFVRSKGEQYLSDPNVSSIGIGYKQKDGEPTGELAIQFVVDRKASPSALEALDTEMLPAAIEVGGVMIPTDVVERKFRAEYRVVTPEALNDRKTRLDPVQPGASVSHRSGGTGTLGCIVYDNVTGTPYVLSNWHVLHTNNGTIGDPVVQPGIHDDNRTERNRLGKLVRSHLGPAGDCAIATIEDRAVDDKILELMVRVGKIGEPALGDKVVKSGRTTGVTHGIVTRVDTLTKIDYRGAAGLRNIGGFEIGVDPGHPSANGEVSQTGDSGSAWIFKDAAGKPTDVLAGIHFAGEASDNPDEYALACYPKSVFEKLQIVPSPPADRVSPEAAVRSGYDPRFLGVKLPAPKLTAQIRKDAFLLDSGEVIDYTHFSLAMNKVRRFAFWVAWNVDGSAIRKLGRNIPFVLDPRVPKDVQVGDELYAGNRLDRGHIARRADLLWGSEAEAKAANKDSFYFTNITPQMEDFNQSSRAGLWGKLEDAVFADAEVDQLRLSVMGGPVFQADDRVYRNIPIPREFWKLILFTDRNQLKAKAFLLTQNLSQLETLDLDEFRVYQVSVSEVEQRTALSFGSAIREADSFGSRVQAESLELAARTPLEDIRQIDWS